MHPHTIFLFKKCNCVESLKSEFFKDRIFIVFPGRYIIPEASDMTSASALKKSVLINHTLSIIPRGLLFFPVHGTRESEV